MSRSAKSRARKAAARASAGARQGSGVPEAGLLPCPETDQTGLDWSAVPAVDAARLETGLYKFSGPEENRGLERISHRELGLVDIAFQAPGSGTWTRVRLWDFTSISFGVVHRLSAPAWPAPAGLEPPDRGTERRGMDPGSPPTGLAIGDEIKVRVRISEREAFEVWCQVKNIAAVQDGQRIGLRRLDVNQPQAVESDRRESFRLPLAPALSLKARVKHPYIFGYWSPLQVSDINREMGLSFLSRDSSILLFEGMELKLHFELATFRAIPMTARITWVYANASDEVKFGVECLDMPWKLHNGICAFLLNSHHWTPGRLRQAGFRAQQVKGRLRFRSVRTMDDYAAVLHLRREAYVGAGKRAEGTTPEEMASQLDGQSRILMAHHHDKLVGSLTFAFPNSEDAALDSQEGFPGGRYPVRIPPKISLIEVSRLCIQEEYRSTDLLQGMFEHGVKHFLMSDRQWLLTSSVTDLLPVYQRIGFKRLGASYKHPRLNFLEHHLIVAHRDTFLWGRGMGVLTWNALFGELIRHLIDRGQIDPPPHVRAIIRAKSLLGPWSRRILDGAAAKAFRKHLRSLRRDLVPTPPPVRPADAPETVPAAAAHGAPADAREAA